MINNRAQLNFKLIYEAGCKELFLDLIEDHNQTLNWNIEQVLFYCALQMCFKRACTVKKHTANQKKNSYRKLSVESFLFIFPSDAYHNLLVFC